MLVGLLLAPMLSFSTELVRKSFLKIPHKTQYYTGTHLIKVLQARLNELKTALANSLRHKETTALLPHSPSQASFQN